MRIAKYLFTFSLILTSGLIALAQEEQEEEKIEAYVVTLKQDTIYGKVAIHIRKGQSQSVSVKTDDGKQTFKVYQVKIVRTDQGSIYHTKKILEKYQFAELVYPGYASYYRFSSEEVTADKFTQQVLIKPDGEFITFSSLAFKKRVAQFLSDCEAVQLKIENGEYKRKDLEAILDEYTACIVSQTELRSRSRSDGPMLTDQEKQRADAFADFTVKVGKSGEFAGNQELMEMLNDVQSKLTAQAPIPGYLKGAIIDELSSNKEFVKEFENLLKTN